MSGPTHLRLRGAREQNLRGVDLDLPLYQWTAVTGPSGSGKSSLVFGTLVREGRRRFLSSLSTHARRSLGKLGAADVDQLDHLPVPIAIGEGSRRASSRSTVGTATGLLDLLRLLFAREASAPEPLRISHFSFNHPLGQCPTCQGSGVQDVVHRDLLVRDASCSLRDGALVPTLKNGYTVYSQVTVEVMDTIARAHGFTVDTPWKDLSREQQDVVLYGTDKLVVPFGKHSLESRMKWEGITAKPREEGHYRGIIPVIEEILQRSRNDNILRFARSEPCDDCHGTRLGPLGRQARLGEHTLPELLATPLAALDLGDLPASDVLSALLPRLERRREHLVRLGLGHLSLDRTAPSLSGGEAQRVHLVGQLAAELSGALYALDEPTLGLHPDEQPGLAALLRELVHAGNTVLTVEHDPDMVRYADHLVQLGPGAGPHGGELLYSGPLPPHPLGTAPAQRPPRPAASWLRLRGATLHNLDHADLDLPLGAFTVLRGRSGAGKSSLLTGTLVPALRGERGGPFTELSGQPDDLVLHVVDATPIGRTPRSTPATWTGLFDRVRKRFAKASGEPTSRFSYNHELGRCPDCEGRGVQRLGLHLLADAEWTCPTCDGGRYQPAVLQTTQWGRTIAAVLQLSAEDATAVFADEPELLPTVQALTDLGLGYLRLGQSSTTLSRGEAQRIKLATLLADTSRRGPSLVVLDEPDRGLHPDDVARLVSALHRLVDQGHTVVAISHHRHLWRQADCLLTLRDGRVLSGEKDDGEPLSAVRPAEEPVARGPIALRGVRTHGLDALDVDIVRGAFTAVTGPSGCGKSSLVDDTLAATAWHRFAESLPFAARRAVRRLPQPDLDEAHGTTPTVSLRQEPPRTSARSTVATLSGLGPLLRLLWSRAGTVDGEPTTLRLSDFDPGQAAAACPHCAGRGTVDRCAPERLIVAPSEPLFHGALEKGKAGRFVGDPDGQYAATLHAAAPTTDWSLPWEALAPRSQQLALHGGGPEELDVTWRYRRGKRTGEHHFRGPWRGLCAIVEEEAGRRQGRKDGADWGSTLVAVSCPVCDGARLGPAARAVTVGGLALHEALSLPLDALPAHLPPGHPLLPALHERLDDLRALQLGHLALDRRSDTLSSGELQRVRLAGALRSGLCGTTLALDEPAAGLHHRDVARLGERLRSLCEAGNTVVAVTHRAGLVAAADHELVLGTAPMGALAPPQPMTLGAVQLRGAHLHNLQQLDLDLPASGVVAFTGVSGSGKSSLVFGVLGASAREGRPVGCRAVRGLERFAEVITPEHADSEPLQQLGALNAFRSLLASQSDSLPTAAFSYRSPKGRCPTCKGSGRHDVAMEGLGDLHLPCPDCDGARYRPEVLAVRWQGLNAHQLLSTPVQDLPAFPVGPLADAVSALSRAGLAHLAFGREPRTLSGGERQRLALAQLLIESPKRRPARLVLLDEPGRGLHRSDLPPLTHLLHELAAAGDLVLLTTHRTALMRSADHLVDLGPEGGPGGGQIVDQGPAEALKHGHTALALRSGDAL